MGTEFIRSRAPTRIDLAGGTLDFWPLYLFLPNATTINVGINLYAEVELQIKPHHGIREPQIFLRSDDKKEEINFPINIIDRIEKKIPPALLLHFKVLNYFFKQKEPLGDFYVTMQAQSPEGAGLGGSSAIHVALIGALASWLKGAPIDPLQEGEKWIEVARDLETIILQVPAGLQDYYSSMYGGIQCLHWQVGSHHRESLPRLLIPFLEKRLLLFYSGKSRNSGINNWSLYKSFIDNQEAIRDKFELMNYAARRLEVALKNQDWSGLAHAITDEWTVRKTLGTEITTSEIDQALAQIRGTVATAGKICGAGGGGCFFALFIHPEERKRVEEMHFEKPIQLLPFQIAHEGLQVSCASI